MRASAATKFSQKQRRDEEDYTDTNCAPRVHRGCFYRPALWVWVSPCLGGAILGICLAIIKINEVEVPDKRDKHKEGERTKERNE